MNGNRYTSIYTTLLLKVLVPNPRPQQELLREKIPDTLDTILVQVNPKLPLRPSTPPKELQQLFLTAQRARDTKPKSLVQLHLETLAAAQAIHTRTAELRAATARLCKP